MLSKLSAVAHSVQCSSRLHRGGLCFGHLVRFLFLCLRPENLDQPIGTKILLLGSLFDRRNKPSPNL